MLKFRQNPKHATQLLRGRELLQSLRELQLQVNAFHGSVLVQSAARSAQWQRGLARLRGLELENVELNVVACNVALGACAKRRAWRRALLLQQHGDACSGDTALTALGWREACCLLRDLAARGLQSSDYGYNAVARAQATAAAGWRRVLEVFHETQRRLTLGLQGFNAALDACKGAACWELAAHLLALMEHAGVEPDVASCSCTMSALTRASRWHHALRLAQDMAKEALQLNRVCYNAVLGAYKEASHWMHALLWLQQMEEDVVPPNEVSYNAVLGCQGNWQLALQILEDMRGRALEPNDISCSAVLTAMAGEWQVALELLRGLLSSKMQKADMSLTAAQVACRRAGKWQAAVALPRLDAVAGSVAALALEDAGHWRAALAVSPESASAALVGRAGRWRLAMELDHKPEAVIAASHWRVALFSWQLRDVVQATAVLSACANAAQWRRAAALHGGLPPPRRDVVAASVVVAACAQRRAWRPALQLLRSCTNADESMYNSVLEAMTGEGPWAVAVHLLASMLQARLRTDGVAYGFAADCCMKWGQWQRAQHFLGAVSSLTPLSATFAR
ncbi:unnamed protein product [Effrenium voratum]|nr:unnamed protein product [Effrenium voratum]